MVETAVEIAAPPEAVWRRLVDWEHLDAWMREASEFQVVTSHREGVGVEARAKIRIAGITTVDTVRVSRWEPPGWFEIEHLGWVKGSGLMHCRPTPAGTWLWWRETLVPPWGLVGWVGMRFLRPAMGWVFRRDVRLLKALVEAPAKRR